MKTAQVDQQTRKDKSFVVSDGKTVTICIIVLSIQLSFVVHYKMTDIYNWKNKIVK